MTNTAIKGKITYADLPGIYEKLSADLPAEAVEHVPAAQSRKGYDATGYQYQYVVNRLNEVLFGHWRTIHRMIDLENAKTKQGKTMYRKACHMTIQIGNWHYENGETRFEVLVEAECYGGHDSTEEVNALKGAYTNAFKKTAALLGVGRRAYEGTLDEDFLSAEAEEVQQSQPQPRSQRQQVKQEAQQLAQERQQAQRSASNPLKRLFAIAKERGISDKALKGLTFYYFNKTSRKDLTQEEVIQFCNILQTASPDQIKADLTAAVQVYQSRNNVVPMQPKGQSAPLTDEEIDRLFGV